ncbi:helix-turn-helix domain-containing protein [Sphingomonas aerolata]|uniref:helix-turn-helix domain-containing protein n=1 Tax=Sphingomonas aerolata TaxID=185951 RepID=UPI00141A9F50|nr:helix-turn-helix domain-containing protein [Sphingomonas aerolata]NII58424.1 cytoskeletal protein RodZ [Sphingomonas aerolata]
MDDVATGQIPPPASPERAGDILRATREAQGLTIADVGGRTRVPLRHLEAIEASDYATLPSSTYAVGFAKAYARAVGADEVRVANLVRAELGKIVRRTPEYEPYEMSDPSRVPSRGVAVIALGIALAVLILVGIWYGTDLFRGGATTSGSAAGSVATVAEVPSPTPASPAAVPAAPALETGQVTLAATDEVWMRVYDADNKTLYLGTMKAGDRFDVPRDAKDPMINVGRPDKLTVTLNGSNVPPLGTGERAIKDVRVGAPAIAARLNGAPAASGGDAAAEGAPGNASGTP